MILILEKKLYLFWMPRITAGNEASADERRFTYKKHKKKKINANHNLAVEVQRIW
jgi:hypothetical protein